MMEFDHVVQKIRYLVEKGAGHKRGFQLSEVTPMAPLIHAAEEIIEVMWEEEQQRGTSQISGEEHVRRVMDELGDVFGCLLHYIFKKGINLDVLLERYARSLNEDFPGEFPEVEG